MNGARKSDNKAARPVKTWRSGETGKVGEEKSSEKIALDFLFA